MMRIEISNVLYLRLKELADKVEKDPEFVETSAGHLAVLVSMTVDRARII